MGRHRKHLLLATGTLVALLLAGAPAHAAGASVAEATPAQRDEALAHFKAGGLAAKKRQLARAVTEYRASLDAVDSPNTRLELSRALRDSGLMVDAWGEYTRTIDAGNKLAAQEERYGKTAEVGETERAEIARKIGLLTVVVSHAPDGATLKVGSATLAAEGWGRPVPVTPGTIELALVSSGAEIAHKSIAVGAGENAAASIDGGVPEAPPGELPGAKPAVVAPPGPGADDRLEVPPPSGAELAAQQTPPPPAASGATSLRPVAYVAGGVGLVGVATFAIFGAMSHSKFNDLEAACHGVCPPGHESDISAGKTDQTIANVGLVVGAVGLVAAVGLFVISMPHSAEKKPASAALVVGPGWLAVRGSL